jgi:hypothetical protein
MWKAPGSIPGISINTFSSSSLLSEVCVLFDSYVWKLSAKASLLKLVVLSPLRVVISSFMPWCLDTVPPVLRIRDVYSGSRIRIFSSPDPIFFYPGSTLKNLISQKVFLSSRKYDPASGSSRIRILIFCPSRIQGSKRHRIRIPDPHPEHWVQLDDINSEKVLFMST